MEEPRQHIQIRERAGLEEARLNQDFIAFVTKWSTPLLVVIALIVGGNFLYAQYAKRQEEKTTLAFDQLAAAAAVANPSPESLRKVAEEFAGVGSVAELARLKAGDAYMRAVMRGVKPGSDLNQDGTLKVATDEMTAEDRASFLDSANEQYKLVAEATSGRRGKEILHVGALFGLAGVAESRGDAPAAKALYEQIQSITSGTTDLKAFSKLAGTRIEDLNSILAVGKLPLHATLAPATKEEPKPVAPPADLPTPSGVMGPVVPAAPAAAPEETAPSSSPVQPSSSPAPAPAPSPASEPAPASPK